MSTAATHRRQRTKVILVGGGLANGLVAWRLAEARPDVDLLVLEKGATLGGAHTWSFHQSDLAGIDSHWLAPLVSCTWDGYEVRFPAFTRRFATPYRTIRSADFHARLAARLGDRARFGVEAQAVTPTSVRLASGETLEADLVIDGRGGERVAPCAYQTFFGLVVTADTPHGLTRPILMDATVPQGNGYRFVYTLPLAERELLVEDTYYSERPELDEAALATELIAYAERLTGLAVRVAGRERGALPIPLLATPPPAPSVVTRSGTRAGLYHPTTGYSLAEAARFAERLVRARDLAAAGPALTAYAEERWRDQEFCRRLNNMLFEAARPHERRAVLQQFYTRDEGVIERFYAGRLSTLDKLKLVSGKPPVPLARGLKAFAGGVAAR